MQQRLRQYILPIVSGILIGTSYIPFPPWALFFALVPLWLFWSREQSFKKVFVAGWITQFILNLIGFHWIAYTAVEFGHFPWPLGLLVLLFFATFAHLYYPLAGLLWKWLVVRLKISETASVILLPFLFLFIERLYPFLFYWHFGYPWLWARFPGAQMAEWIGFFGLNLISLIINAFFLIAFLFYKYKRNVIVPIALAVGLFLVVNLAGWAIKPPPGDQKLRVLAVQGNIGNLEKIQAEVGGAYREKVVSTFLRLTQAALQKNGPVDLIVWPETAFPEVIVEDRKGYYRQQLLHVLQENQTALLTGAYYYSPQKDQVHNSLVLMQQGHLRGRYDKTHLLAFGEYLPFGEMFPSLKKLLPMIADFGRGPGPSVMDFNNLKLGPQICYEGLFDEFSAKQQNLGAQIFINVTNDSWFGYPFEPYQHMYMTLARALENRRPLVRSTNTGITTVIHSDGTLQELSPHNQEWAHVYNVPIHTQPPMTVYRRIAPWWPLILLTFIMMIIMGDRIVRTRKY